MSVGNHTGYGQVKGTKATAADITDLYHGLKNSGLDEFDMMLSGYIPGKEAVQAVGAIARELKFNATMKPGSFFWVLDPVMGDNGRLYVAEEIVPEYKKLVHDADLIMPNQYEAEYVLSFLSLLGTNVWNRWLSGVKITDMDSLVEAIMALHGSFKVPHVVITSVNFAAQGAIPSLSIVGSTKTSTDRPRIFQVQVPSLDCFFSGTGDMFAALMVVRLREAVCAVEGLLEKNSWVSDDDVPATELPLAKAVEKALASMQEVLTRTMTKRDKELAEWEAKQKLAGTAEEESETEKVRHLKKTRAAEVRLVRNLECLKHPVVKYEAENVEF